MGQKLMSEYNELIEANGVYFLCSAIDENAASDIIPWILAHNMADNKPEFLTIIISSEGGLIDYSFAITDMMKGSIIPIRTVGLGVVASCGLMIFMAGAKGERILTPNTSILSHQFSGGEPVSKQHELLAAKKNIDIAGKKILNHYKIHTNLDEKTIKKKLLPPQDVWLTAEEAKSLGICDEVKYL